MQCAEGACTFFWFSNTPRRQREDKSGPRWAEVSGGAGGQQVLWLTEADSEGEGMDQATEAAMCKQVCPVM